MNDKKKKTTRHKIWEYRWLVAFLLSGQVLVYFITGKNPIEYLFLDFYHDMCCTSSVYFAREYAGTIAKTRNEGNTIRIDFEGIDTTHILNRHISTPEGKMELSKKIKPGMYFFKPAFDSVLTITKRNKDTLKLPYSTTPYRGNGPLIISKIRLENIALIPAKKSL